MSEGLKLVHRTYIDPLTGQTIMAYERFTYQQEHDLTATGTPLPRPGVPAPGRNHVPKEWKTDDKKIGYKDLISGAKKIGKGNNFK